MQARDGAARLWLGQGEPHFSKKIRNTPNNVVDDDDDYLHAR